MQASAQHRTDLLSTWVITFCCSFFDLWFWLIQCGCCFLFIDIDSSQLCLDVSTTMILQPGPVINFLKTNQGVREVRYIDWVKVNNH